jgi:DNA-binding MarR family transcriptional regulator
MLVARDPLRILPDNEITEEGAMVLAEAASSLDIYSSPGHLIRRMHQASQAIFDGQMARAGFDLTPVQFAALRVVADRPGLDQATLAAAIAFDRATTGGVVDRLESKQLVRREIDVADRRARRLHAEAAGMELLAQVAPVVAQVQQQMLRGLSPDEQALLMQLLDKALAAVGDVSRPALRDIRVA